MVNVLLLLLLFGLIKITFYARCIYDTLFIILASCFYYYRYFFLSHIISMSHLNKYRVIVFEKL